MGFLDSPDAPSPDDVDGRGRYDRTMSPAERLVDQRERLLAAIADRVSAGLGLSVTVLTEMAHVGRNTFYVHFSDTADAVDALVHTTVSGGTEALRAALAAEVTPARRLAAWTDAWPCFVQHHRRECAALRQLPVVRMEPLRAELRATLAECVDQGRRDGLLSRPADPERIAACVGAVLEVSWLGLEASRPQRPEFLPGFVLQAFR